MRIVYGIKKAVSRRRQPPLQKLVTIELSSGCGFQWHLEPYLHDGWNVAQMTPIAGGSARVDGSEVGAASGEQVTAWLAVLLEKPFTLDCR